MNRHRREYFSSAQLCPSQRQVFAQWVAHVAEHRLARDAFMRSKGSPYLEFGSKVDVHDLSQRGVQYGPWNDALCVHARACLQHESPRFLAMHALRQSTA